MMAPRHDDLLTQVVCATCCQPFTVASREATDRAACPHCGAHHLFAHRAREPLTDAVMGEPTRSPHSG